MIHSSDTVYIAGPMSLYKDTDWNYPAFLAMEEALCRLFQCAVRNPARNFDGRTDLPRAAYLRQDIPMVLASTAIVFLPDWTRSRGALLEYDLGSQLGLALYNDSFEALSPHIIHEQS